MRNSGMIKLDGHTRLALRQMQRRETDKRQHVKLTVILMLDGGISVEDITYSFGIDTSTIYRYAEKYRSSQSVEEYLRDAYTPYDGKLSDEQCTELGAELRERLFRTATEVAAYIKERWGIEYTATGLVPLLKRLGFVYKKTRPESSKADAEKQELFSKSSMSWWRPPMPMTASISPMRFTHSTTRGQATDGLPRARSSRSSRTRAASA